MTGFLRFFSFRHRAFLLVWYVVGAAACLIFTARLGWRFTGIFGLLGMVYPVYLTAQALALRAELRLRGYEWITFRNAFALAARRGHKVWRLPPRDETAGTPGYEDTVQGLEQFLLQAHDEPVADARIPELERMWKESRTLPAPAPTKGQMRWTTSSLSLLVAMGVLNVAVTAVCFEVSWDLAWLYFLNFPIGWGFWLLLAWALRGHLDKLGYGAWSLRDRIWLAYRCQLLCRYIPRAEDLGDVLGGEGPIPPRTLARAVMTIAWLQGKAGRTIR